MPSSSKQTGKHLGPEERSEDARCQMTEAEEQACARALHEAHTIIFRFAHEREASEFKWTERPVVWVKDETRNSWLCDVPPSRAKVMFEKDDWFWRVCIEKRAKSEHRPFLHLEEAVVWAEEQLAAAAEEAEPEVETAPSPVPGRPKMDLGPYRISPSALEPERITYRVIVELDAMPEQYRTMELSTGQQVRYDEHYLSVGRLGADLQIDAECELERPFGPNHGWYLGHSTVTYYRESVAVEQAQLIWNKSRIVEHYRKGKLLRARYGIQEVETGHISWLGGCENPEEPWGKPMMRAEYLAKKAEELTRANALDIDGFREFAGWSQETASDERILSILHQRRAHSLAIPAENRAESRRWLAEHQDRQD